MPSMVVSGISCCCGVLVSYSNATSVLLPGSMRDFLSKMSFCWIEHPGLFFDVEYTDRVFGIFVVLD